MIMEQTTTDRVLAIIADHIRQHTGRMVEPEPGDHLFDDLGCDSLDRVEICFAAEECFGLPEINEGRVFFVSDIIRAVAREGE